MRKFIILSGLLVLVCCGITAVASGSVTTKTVAVAAPNRLQAGEHLRARFNRRVLRWQWLRCNAQGRACRAIRGATHAVYTVRAADIGHTLRARAVIQGNTVAVSAPTGQVGRPLPVNTALPTLSDASTVGGTLAQPYSGDVLTGTNGTWQHAVRFTYQWEDCTTATPPVCTAITGATTSTYTIQDSDVGFTIVFQVTAYNF